MTAYGSWDGTMWYVMACVVLAIAALVFRPACAMNECSAICKANGDRSAWTWTQGCYCRDDAGMYNPKDSRDR